MPIRPEMKARYPQDWHVRSRFVRYYRAKNRCEWCGVPNRAAIYRCPDDRREWVSIDIQTGEVLEISSGWQRLYDAATTDWFEDRNPIIVVLTVAHVFDHRPEAASLLNLAALCQRCHNRHDAKHRAEGVKARRAENQMVLSFG